MRKRRAYMIAPVLAAFQLVANEGAAETRAFELSVPTGNCRRSSGSFASGRATRSR